MDVDLPSRRRVSEDDRKKNRQLSISYRIRGEEGKEFKVCAATFCKITGVSADRLRRIAKRYKFEGKMPKENRGGRPSRLQERDEEQTEHVKRDILKYKCRASHYSRNKIVRSYLPPELNLKQMYERYRQTQKRQGRLCCSLTKYKNVFYKYFNLGFGSPHTDTCSACSRLLLNIKSESNLDEKNKLRTEYRLHKLRAKKFFQILNTTGDKTITICFDCQQNQPLPKLSIGEIFYSRQVWLYNFTILQLCDKKATDVVLYTWLETDAGRGANEIVSALKDYLVTLEEKLSDKNKSDYTLRLFSDSCSSQNKNSIMMTMLFSYIEKSKVFNEVHHYFPIRGHSYMPPDRIFGNIEKDLRKCQIITLPSEYYDILRKYGLVKVWGEDWKTYDFKTEVKKVIKGKLPFKMTEVRILSYLKTQGHPRCKCLVQNTYFSAPIEVEILKKGVTSAQPIEKAQEIQSTNHVSKKKSEDIRKLLSYFEYNSEEGKKFYGKVLQGNGNYNDAERQEYSEEPLY